MDRRLRAGAWAGLLATAGMTAIMLAGSASGMSPIPRPIPVAIAAWLVRGALPRPALIAFGMLLHFAYGAVAGALFARVLGRWANLWTGAALGVLLWAGMGLFWLPLLHWGRFGAQIDPRIGLATLVLHLVYGVTLGLGVMWQRRRGWAEA